MHGLLVVLLAALTLSVASAAEPSFVGSVKVEPGQEQAWTLAQVTMAEALGTAAGHAAGQFVEAELEVENGFLVFGLEAVDDEGVHREVVVDAGDGQVLAVLLDEEDEGEDDIEAEEEGEENDENEGGVTGQLGISMMSAVEMALAEQPGTALEAELETEGGAMVYEVEIVAEDGMRHEVGVDPVSGEVVMPGEEQEDDGEEAEPGEE